MKTDTEIMDAVLWYLKVLGATSLTSLIGLYCAWLAFPPEIIVDAVIDKSKKLNSESKVKLKNIGRLPALNVTSTITELNVTLDSLSMENCEIRNPPRTVHRLANSETCEISVSPGIHIDGGGHYSKFEYKIQLDYRAKLFGISRMFKKSWRVSLRNFGEEFSWNVEIFP